MKKRKYFYVFVAVILISSFLLSACELSDADATPTLTVEEVQTLAVGTFSASLTETAIAMPTSTSTPTITPSPTLTITPMMTNTPGTPFGAVGVLPTTSCNSMAYVSDVNIPDNTTMKPGQTFTKTWRVRNNGTCVWDAGFKLSFVGGDAMGGTSLVLGKAVNPGEEIEISVPMVAPSTAGSIRGNWKMATTTGTFFGDEIYLIIVVSGSGTAATVPATTATTETPTPDLTATAAAAIP